MITRDQVLEFLNDVGKPILEMDLIKALEIDSLEAGAFMNMMDELEGEGKVIRTKKGKYALPIKMNIFLGKLQTNQKGFGFVIVQNAVSEDIFIPASEMEGGMNGDLVYCKVTGVSELGRKKEGIIVKIIKRANEKVVGTFDASDSYGFVVPDDKKLSMDIYIPRSQFNGAKSGQKVVVKITK